MEQLLGLMNKLMRVFAQANVPNIQLPRIAVVGSQSSGKSSVLEAIVQRDFLPRGSGIVTRRPLILHLVNESRNADKTEWGEFGHLPGKRFTDFPLIRREIERYTDMEAGSNKGIISKPIFLTIHSPNVVDLILVDLPGLTKVAVGDQPQDIEKQVRELIESYIKEQMTIILAVSPGNVDLANSDALKLAHKWDPEGNRTLGVITKLDLLDQGTDAADMLQNRVIPLRLGYIGLVMRGQKDIAEDKDVKTALQDEETFFRQHYAYQTFANKCGTRFLGKSLSTLLLSHVQKFLPQTRAAIQLSLKRFEEELSRLGGSPEESQGGLNAMMLRIISDFSNKYTQKLEGEVSDSDPGQLVGGARINHVFKELYSEDLARISMDLGMSEDELLIQVRNSLGVNSTLFVPEKCFLLLAVRQIERLRQPSMRCLDATHRECIRILGQSLDQVKGPERFPKLKRRLLEEATQMVAGMRKKAEEILNYLIDIEEAYINIKHPDFDAMRCLTAVVEEREKQKNMNAQNPQRRGQQSYDQLMQAVSNQDAIKVELVRRLVLLYFAIVRKSIGDSVPKSVMNFLVNKSAKEIQNQLMRNLYKESLFQELMAEDDGITKRRIMCNERRNVLKEAMNILDDVSFQADTYSITEGTEGVAEDGHVTEEVYFREKRQKEQEKAKLAKEHDREKQWDQNKDSNVFSSGPLRSFQDGQQQGYTQKGRAGSPSQQTSTSQQDISYDQQGQTKYPSYSPSGIQPRIQGQAVPESLNQYDSSSTGVSSSTSKQNLSQSLRPPPSISPSQQQQYTKGVGSATVADANAIMSLFGSPTLNTSSSTFSQDSDKKDDDKDSIKKKEHRHHRDKDKDKDKSKDDDNDEKLNVLQQQQLKDKQKKKDKEGK